MINYNELLSIPIVVNWMLESLYLQNANSLFYKYIGVERNRIAITHKQKIWFRIIARVTTTMIVVIATKKERKKKR